MNKIILDGKAEAEKIIKILKHKIIKARKQIGLAVILVGNNKASETYVNIKEKRAKELGVYFEKHILPATISEKKILSLIDKLNKDKKITGILVQLPLPKKIDTNKIINAIDMRKDVDGFKSLFICHPEPVSESPKRCRNEFGMTKKVIPPTIASVLHLIKMAKIKLTNKKAVILANSLEFAEPLKRELEKEKILVKIYVKAIHELPLQIKTLGAFDIIIIALGKKYFLKPAMIKKNAVVIDVGITRVGKKIYGDVYPDCFKKSKHISPVPGGVGPLTVAYLFKNLIQLKNSSIN